MKSYCNQLIRDNGKTSIIDLSLKVLLCVGIKEAICMQIRYVVPISNVGKNLVSGYQRY